MVNLALGLHKYIYMYMYVYKIISLQNSHCKQKDILQVLQTSRGKLFSFLLVFKGFFPPLLVWNHFGSWLQTFQPRIVGCENAWKPGACVCGKTSYSWKGVCFEFTASCCFFRSTRLCGTSTLNYNMLWECGNPVSCFRCAVCLSKLAPFLSRSKKSDWPFFLLAFHWYYC